MATKMKRKAPMTNIELVTDIMTFSKHGALAQLFVMDALIKFSERVAASKPEDYPAEGFVSPEAWIAVAAEIRDKINNRE